MAEKEMDAQEHLEEFYKKIDDYLENKEGVVASTVQLDWDYADEISTNLASEVLEDQLSTIQDIDKKHFLYFYKEAIAEKYDYFWDDVDRATDYLATQAIEELEKEGWYNFEEYEVLDYLRDEYEIDYNLDKLLEHTKVNLHFTIANKSWDDSYFDFKTFQRFNYYNVKRIGCLNHNTIAEKGSEGMDVQKLQNLLDGHPLAWLLQTQGYSLTDFYNDDKIKSSAFLKSLYEEINDYDTILSGMQITFAISDISLFDVANCPYRTFKVSKDTNCGLYNEIHGSGSGFNIELEKDIILPFDKVSSYVISYENGRGVHGEYVPARVYASHFNGSIEQVNQLPEPDFEEDYELLIKQFDTYKDNQLTIEALLEQ